jgi:hypothetical protein
MLIPPKAAFAASVAALACLAAALFMARGGKPVSSGCDGAAQKPIAADSAPGNANTPPKSRPQEEPAVLADASSSEEEDRLVEAFDMETDSWLDIAKALPTMQDVLDFKAKFNRVPANRKVECLQRALNLLPDEHVLLLAGILMDKTQERDVVELVYRDILNRPDAVKTPVLKQIYADREHPCWDDTRWIFEVTGEKASDGSAPSAP